MAGIKIGSLFGDVSLRTSGLKKGVAEAKRKMAELQTATRELGQNMVKVSAPIAALGPLAVRSFSEFEKGAAEVGTLLSDLDRRFVFDDLIDQTRELATVMGTDLNDATGALYQTISAGIDPRNGIEFLEAASKGAIAGVTDVGVAVDGLSTVLNAYGMEAASAKRISDQMFTAVRLGKTTFEEISSSMFQAVPLAASMGVKFDELMGILVALTKQGVPTRTAFTQIRAALSNLMKPTADMQKALKALGVETAQELISQRGLVGAFQAIRVEAGLTDMELGKAFGSVEGLSAVLGTTGQNFMLTKNALGDIATSAGATDKAFEQMANTFKFQFDRLKAVFQDLSIELGERLKPGFEAFINLLRQFVTDNKEAILKFSELGVAIAGIVLAVGLLLMGISAMLPALFLLAPVVALLIASFGGWNEVSTLAATSFEEFANKFLALKDKIVEYVGGFETAEELFADIKNRLLGQIDSLVQGIKNGWNDFIENTWPKIVIRLKVQYNKLLIATEDFRTSFMTIYDSIYNMFAFLYNAGVGLGNIGRILTGNYNMQQTVPYAGARANGGPVMAGKSYLVGERGPEMFVPKYSGDIIPNGGGNITMNFAPGTDMSTVAMLKNMKQGIADIAINAVSENNLRTA